VERIGMPLLSLPGRIARPALGGHTARCSVSKDSPMTPTLSGARRLAARMLTVDQTAEQLQLSPKSVRRLIENNELVVHRIGRCIRVSEDDLQVFLNRRRR
jgi:excisionase family DNA binding protein